MKAHEFFSRKDVLAFEDNFDKNSFQTEYIINQIGQGKKVLDVGCGSGSIAQLIQMHHNEVWAVELNKEAATKAIERGIRVQVADIEDGLKFANSSFDVVCASKILEQLYDTKFFMDECCRVLKPNGLCLVTAYNFNHFENRLRMIAGKYPKLLGAYPEDHGGENIRVLNISKIKELCHETGFLIEEIRGMPFAKSFGKYSDFAMNMFGQVWPGLSKLFIIKAKKRQEH